MRPSVSEQLDGIRAVLAEIISPQITDAYPADVLAGALATLDMLAASWSSVPAFLRWDSDASAAVLALVGEATPPPPEDVLDLDALIAHQRAVRGALESAMPVILDDEGARAAVVLLFRERAARFPMTVRPTGGHGAHAAR